ncbi:MAG: hypothetical protein KAT35_01770 [Candidatus Aenigmarchaeota archaeon]|nr:hypothetical protein [Candidatus Aenigmarchaeota archaeon]
MFRWYGGVGLFMVLFAQLNFIFRIQPFAQWYFPIIWFGYILLVDALVYSMSRESLITGKPKVFLFMLGLSAVAWWVFEAIGWVLGNWHYSGTGGFGSSLERLTFATLSFSTVIPAVFETALLLKTVHLFDAVKLEEEHRISKNLLYGMMFAGILMFAAPLLYPGVFYPLIWVSFFLILDPINYMNKRPSIISHLKDRKLAVPLSIYAGATLTGFLWEFWNYWAIPKWHYTIPFVDFLKVFEMPVLGYLGYGPFGLELFAMYHFFMWLIHESKARTRLFS